MSMNILELFEPEGVWAILSVFLIFYIMKGQEKRDERQDVREQNYQKIILELSHCFNTLKHKAVERE